MSARAPSESELAGDRHPITTGCGNCKGWTAVFTEDGRLVDCPDHSLGDEEISAAEVAEATR